MMMYRKGMVNFFFISVYSVLHYLFSNPYSSPGRAKLSKEIETILLQVKMNQHFSPLTCTSA